ncbi:MAG: DNA topoisomerase VI subunit B [Acidobacteriota bacterium]
MRQSLDADEIVLVERDGRIAWVQIGSLVDPLVSEGEEVKRARGIRVPAFVPRTGRYQWMPVSHVIRHERANDVIEIRTEGGRSVRVTACHSLFTIDRRTGAVVSVDARDLREGSHVVAPKCLPEPGSVDCVNVLSELPEPELRRRWLYVYGLPAEVIASLRSRAVVVHKRSASGRPRRYLRFETSDGRSIDVLDDSFRQYQSKGFLPAWLARGLSLMEECGGAVLRSYHHGRPLDVPVTWRLSPALMRLLGLFVAGGHSDRRQVGFTLSEREDHLAEEIERAARYHGLSTSRERRDRHAQRVKLFGGAVDLLFPLWCGRGARNKQVPHFVFRAGRELRQHFLDGLYQGDGHRVRGRAALMWGSTSARLVDDVQVLWLLQGVCTSRTGPLKQRGLGKDPSMSWRLDVHRSDIDSSHVFRSGGNHHENRHRVYPRALVPFATSAGKGGRVRVDPVSLGAMSGIGVKGLSLVEALQPGRSYSVEDMAAIARARVTCHVPEHMTELGLLTRSESGYAPTVALLEMRRAMAAAVELGRSDLCLLRVTKVSRVENPGKYVYDLSVPGAENFVGGTGAIACHNSRGQQGIGISAAGMYGQLTTGKPVRITSKTTGSRTAHYYEIQIDTRKNNPEVAKDEEVTWDVESGTRVEIELQAVHKKGRHSVDDYLRQTALANPHAEIRYVAPDGEEVFFARASQELPVEPKEIQPHPYGVELGALIQMLSESKARHLSQFLRDDFARVSPKVAMEICQKAALDPGARPARVSREDIEKLHRAIPQVKIMAPPTSCLSPIGEALVQRGLEQKVKADFYVATTRPPSVYRGNPFQIEVGLAWGGDLPGDEPITLYRFANRVPLQYQQSACAVTRGVMATPWRNYAIPQPKGALPLGPMVLMVHIASVWVPFTSESKEAVAHYPEILKEIKLALMECGRKLGAFLSRRRRDQDEAKKRSYIEMYLPHVGIALKEILGLKDAEEEEIVTKLADVLERSRARG